MSDWIKKEEFEKTEYGKLDNLLKGKNYFGKLDKAKLPPNSTIIPDPKDGAYGIIKDAEGNPVGKVELD